MAEQSIGRVVRDYFNISRGRASFKIINQRIHDLAHIDGIHLITLIVAMVIASIGLNVDSTEAVIGAMLICPLMGSVLAIAYSIATIDLTYLRTSVFGLLLQVAICLTTSTLYFVLSPLTGATSELISNSSPTIWDLLIAFVGGFAGGLGNSRRNESGTLIAGVAVATALMPPLCATGYGLALRNFALALSAFYEFLINVVFIAFGAEIVFVWLKLPLQRDLNGDGTVTPEEEERAQELSRGMRRRLVAGSLVFAVPCLFVSGSVVSRTIAENGGELREVVDVYDTEMTTLELKAVFPSLVSYRVGAQSFYDFASGSVGQRVVGLLETSEEIGAEERAVAEELVRLHVPNLEELQFVVTGGQGSVTFT